MNCALFELGQFAFHELSCFKNEKEERHLYASNKIKLGAYPGKEKKKKFHSSHVFSVVHKFNSLSRTLTCPKKHKVGGIPPKKEKRKRLSLDMSFSSFGYRQIQLSHVPLCVQKT